MGDTVHSTDHRPVASARKHRLPPGIGEGTALHVVGVPQEAAYKRLRRRSIPDLQQQRVVATFINELPALLVSCFCSHRFVNANNLETRSCFRHSVGFWTLVLSPEMWNITVCPPVTPLPQDTRQPTSGHNLMQLAAVWPRLTTNERSAPQDTRNMLSPLHPTSQTGNPSWCPLSSRTCVS